jgi:hypothetical protein
MGVSTLAINDSEEPTKNNKYLLKFEAKFEKLSCSEEEAW